MRNGLLFTAFVLILMFFAVRPVLTQSNPLRLELITDGFEAFRDEPFKVKVKFSNAGSEPIQISYQTCRQYQPWVFEPPGFTIESREYTVSCAVSSRQRNYLLEPGKALGEKLTLQLPEKPKPSPFDFKVGFKRHQDVIWSNAIALTITEREDEDQAEPADE